MTRGVQPRPANERFWAKVQKSVDCWTWTGATHTYYAPSRPSVRCCRECRMAYAAARRAAA